jgi:phosphotransferase system enzyme I (PtsP)
MADDSAENWMAIPRQIDGISLNTGVGLGRAVLHRSIGAKTVVDREPPGGDSKAKELARLNHALGCLVDEIQVLISQQLLPKASTKSSPKSPQTKSQVKDQADSRDILGIYLMLANDPGWKRQLSETINEGRTALDAVDETLRTIRETLSEKGNNTLWHERISDFEDISSRLKRYLGDSSETSNRKSGDSLIIVVADRIGPAELLEYDRERLAGLILVEQSQTSHVAIVARSLEIPVVGGMKNMLSHINEGDSILIDGNEGRVYIRPVSDVIRRFDLRYLIKKRRSIVPKLEKIAPVVSQTLDGVSISLLLNAGLVEDVDYIEAAGAEGVGLYRTEIPFMMRPKLPNVTEQTNLYREIIKRAGNYPVVFRTLDVGGDKVLPYLERLKSDNPIREARVTRVFFDRPILLRYQLRALIRACEGGELTIMLPMIAEVDEVKAAREVMEGEIERERTKGNPIPSKIRLGAMIEVPSLVYQLPELFPHVDFLSIGSNDLFQFFYAIDRENPKLSNRYDVLSPTFLSLLKSIQDQCSVAKIPLSVCGEMAGRPLEALALIGLGYRTLSMSAPAVPLVKKMVRSITYQQIADYMTDVCVPLHSNIRQSLRHFARDHNILCD